MKNSRTFKAGPKEISKRECLVSGFELLAVCSIASGVAILPFDEQINEKSTAIDEQYVLVDGWLLMADDLIS